ncbi:hypothetical protein FIA58_011725 [Flavobacterium jejuense]|uniref:Uncharacterized protein n=1 Tax=Flavobacterium jejuense TaxID=1544455 RepID=A0ABX0IX20_9FLAO|nr:hypothetical protein [Flavobacterium jejuense]NHN26349.1 hypothetical protein [Flavobacterium jejuense]
MKKVFLNLLVFSSLICFANAEDGNTEIFNKNEDINCDTRMFDAMDWAAEAGLDDQQIADAGNAAYAFCWLMVRNLNR